MSFIVSVSGSPSRTSRTARLLHSIESRLESRGHEVAHLSLRSLPPAALLAGDTADPEIAAALDLVARADGLVVGTPVFKAAYSGLLKAFLDVLPQHGLAGKTALPLATGGSQAHVLAIDYALRPVLQSMGADRITQGWFVLDRSISVREDGSTALDDEVGLALGRVVNSFAEAVEAAAPLPLAVSA